MISSRLLTQEGSQDPASQSQVGLAPLAPLLSSTLRPKGHVSILLSLPVVLFYSCDREPVLMATLDGHHHRIRMRLLNRVFFASTTRQLG